MAEEVRPYIVLYDERRLRGAALESLLREWTACASVDIRRFKGSLDARDRDPAKCRMCIIDVGTQRLDSVSSRVALAVMHALFPAAPIVVLSENTSACEPQRAREVAQGFVPADTEPAVMFAALDLVLSGGVYIPQVSASADHADRESCWHEGDHDPASDGPESSRSSYAGNSGEPEDPSLPLRPDIGGLPHDGMMHASLTARQKDVLEGLHAGKSNKNIARDLNLSEATIKIHVRQLMRKLGVTNRTQLAMITMQNSKPPRETRGYIASPLVVLDQSFRTGTLDAADCARRRAIA